MLAVQREWARIEDGAELHAGLDVEHLILVHAAELRLQAADRQPCIPSDEQAADGRCASAARDLVDGEEQLRWAQGDQRRRLREQHRRVQRGVHGESGPAVPAPRTADDDVGRRVSRGDAHAVGQRRRQPHVVAIEEPDVDPRGDAHAEVARLAHAAVDVPGVFDVADPVGPGRRPLRGDGRAAVRGAVVDEDQLPLVEALLVDHAADGLVDEPLTVEEDEDARHDGRRGAGAAVSDSAQRGSSTPWAAHGESTRGPRRPPEPRSAVARLRYGRPREGIAPLIRLRPA